MNTTYRNGNLTVRIDYPLTISTAPDVNNIIDKTRIHHPHMHLILDVTDMPYISSSGLRLLIKQFKSDPNMMITGVSEDTYEVLSLVGYTDFMQITKAGVGSGKVKNISGYGVSAPNMLQAG